ncbi:hypothetical protein [Streptomyces sp. NPDC094472]
MEFVALGQALDGGDLDALLDLAAPQLVKHPDTKREQQPRTQP